jgi:hypothetical protein
MDHQKINAVEIPLCNECTHIAFAGTTLAFASTFCFQSTPFLLENTITTSGKIVIVSNYNFENYLIRVYSPFKEEEQMELSEEPCLIF